MTVDRLNLPKARTEKLIIKDLSDETLVYDLESDKAHCLNSTASWVWKNCNGATSVKNLSVALAKEMNCALDESVIWFALDQLEKFDLLEQPITPAENFVGMNRRQWVRRIGVAAVALPLIISISAPTASAQGSCPPGPNNQPPGCPCNGNGNCTNNSCVGNICA